MRWIGWKPRFVDRVKMLFGCPVWMFDNGHGLWTITVSWRKPK